MVALLKSPMHLTSNDLDRVSAPRLTLSNRDRRLFERKPVQMKIEGRRLDHSVSARQHPRVSLSVCDVSLGGLSAISNLPIPRGEHLNVVFPAQGAMSRWDAFGRVIRCEESPTGYRLAVEFDPLPAA